jgi:hypothetical protein
MSRPYMSHGINQIEELFEQSKTLPQILNLIGDELKHRKTPRALALNERVSSLLSRVSLPQAELKFEAIEPVNSPLLNSRKEADVLALAPATQLAIDPLIELTPLRSQAAVQHPLLPYEPVPTRQQTNVSVAFPLMALAEALSALGVKLETPWDVVEQARRSVVNSSSPELLRNLPSDDRAVKLQAAANANNAYRSLVIHRAY